MISLAGGPPHQDMLDLKPDAPFSVRVQYLLDRHDPIRELV